MYVNTYILAVPEEKKGDYLSIAKTFVEVAAAFGAIEVYENWEQDVPAGEYTDYRKAVRAEPGEKIVVSWVIWPDRGTADKAHKRMFEDKRMIDIGDMPFDTRRIILGGFEPLVSYHKPVQSR